MLRASAIAILGMSVLGGNVQADVEFYGDMANGRAEPLKKSLNLQKGRSLWDGLDEVMSSWPVPARLSELGVDDAIYDDVAIAAAADRAIHNGPRRVNAKEIREILSSAH